MPGMTDAGEAGLLNHTLGGPAWTSPAQVYAAWCTSDPTDSGNQGSEIGRTLMTGFNAAANRSISNTNLVAVDTTGWTDANPITHVAFVEAATAGTYFWSDALTNPVTFVAGEALEIPAGGFVLNLVSASILPAFSISDNASNKWLDHMFGTTAWTQPTGQVVRLHTDNPSQSGTANEFTGGGYAAQTFTLGALDAVGNATRGRNSNAIQFLNMQSTPLNWWTIHSSLDFLFAYDQTTKTVSPGSTIDIPANRLEVLVT